MSDIKIGLKHAQRVGAAGLLRQALADEYVLYTKTRRYHWNVESPGFIDLHKLLEKQYSEIEESIDEIAERIRSLGEYSPGSMKEFLADARLTEDSGPQVAAMKMIGNLLADHEALASSLRIDLEKAHEEFGDAGTQDFLTGLLEEHEKTAWMLRSILR